MSKLSGPMIMFAAGYWYLSRLSSGIATDICFSLSVVGFLLLLVEYFLNELRSFSDAGINLKPTAVRFLIVFFVSMTLLASLLYPSGKPHYRQKEREEAMNAYTLNPSASTQAAVAEEFSRLDHHQKMVQIILPPSVLLFDAVVVYFFWNYGRRKTTMTGNSPESTPLAHPMN
jgi:hypothetical protein